MSNPAYIELHARSAFSFLRGASLPDQLVATAAQLGLPAIAVTDRMGVYGAPRLSSAAQAAGLQPIFGSELVLDDGSVLPVLVENRAGYQNLCQLLTRAHLRSPKGEAAIGWGELSEFAPGLVALTGDEEGPLVRSFTRGGGSPTGVLDRLVDAFGRGNLYVEVQRHLRRGEDRLNAAILGAAATAGLPLLATNGVIQATPNGRAVADVFTCLRHHTTLDQAGVLLAVNAERALKTSAEMKALFVDHPEAVSNSVRLADRLRFELKDLGYEFPRYPCGPDETQEGILREWAYAGARERYVGGIPLKIRDLLEKELAVINRLGFAGYFLIVADLVRYCRREGIMAQGRGSAANSAVCYCLGVTAVDPVRFNVLFERFLTEDRKGWPDIDIDLPSGDRREQVIQEVYRRYGPHGAAMTGTIITYRGRSTAREVGKVLGFPPDIVDRFANLFASGDFPHTLDLSTQMGKAGLPAGHPRASVFASLYQQITRLPRHLGQHSGGMIICQGSLNRFIPLENAAMPGRVVAQWDKDDCEDLGIIKVDLLGLGMMSALQDCVALSQARGNPVDLAQLPENDPETFEMIRAAETIGVFQIESRAQMATLPRMKPTCFYDLVIEVAIIRPGPIQGDLAHPFLRRRSKEEPVTYYAPQLEPVLQRTLGVPLFQEQMLQMAMVMAGFNGAEAEELRRAMSFHRSDERMTRAQEKLRLAMQRASVPPDVAERIVTSVGSFALYGFPESHAISFAHLAYASAYLKVHRPSEFYCALLNNQPMGFYSSATLIKDARRRGIRTRPVCVTLSDWDCTIEPDGAILLGLRQVQGLNREHAATMVYERKLKPFSSLDNFRSRTRFGRDELRTLADIGALNQLSSHRRAALWETEKPLSNGTLWNPENTRENSSPLRPMNPVERLQADYSGLRLTTGPHPMALVRNRLATVWTSADLLQVQNGVRIEIAGQVICRQRPGTAKGICFISLEDETGISNAIVSPELFEAERLTITSEPFLAIIGIAQSRHGTVHIKAEKIRRLDFAELQTADSHDFC
jgi:error-prone DNA polymerase